MKDDLTPDSMGKQQESIQKQEEEAHQPQEAQEEIQVTEEEAQRAMEVLKQEQNLAMGAIYGLIAALVGAGVWAGITVATEYQIGWMAVGVGFLVGLAVRLGGKGIDQIFGVVGAVTALIGCALGNLFTIVWFISKDFGISPMDVLTQLDASLVFELMSETFQAIDILFYALALYFGYRYAFRQISMEDFNRALGRAM